MSYSIPEVRAWRPIQLADSASLLAESNADFESQLDVMIRSADTATWTWTGTGADAAYRRIEAEHGAGRKIAATVEKLVAALAEGSERLHSVRGNAVAKIEAALADGFVIDDGSWAVMELPVALVRLTPERIELHELHRQSVAAARSQLVDEDRAVSFAIDAAVDEVVATGRDAAAGLRYAPPTLADLAAGDAPAMLGSAEFAAWLRDHPDAAKGLMDGVVDTGLLPPDSDLYRNFLRDYWQRESLERAGIDPVQWDPAQGAPHNRDSIIKAYEYYGDLFLDNPELKWAGMANMIGPSFAGGFFDLDSMKTVASAIGSSGTINGMDVIANMTAADFKFYETSFLSMQKEIFEDQAAMHEAYLIGGVEEIERMKNANLIDGETAGAWRGIDRGLATGDQKMINDGNTLLLHREQMNIIADDYERMRSHPVTGPAMTYLMTAVGAPSIPGAQTYAEFDPWVFELETPGPRSFLGFDNPFQGTVTIDTPLPGGNIADRDDRWGLVKEDTLPAYLSLVDGEPSRARSIIESDFASRMEEQRLSHQVDDIAKRMISGFGLGFDQ